MLLKNQIVLTLSWFPYNFTNYNSKENFYLLYIRDQVVTNLFMCVKSIFNFTLLRNLSDAVTPDNIFL